MKTFIVVLLLSITTLCFADDKVMIQIIFTEDIPINGTTITYTDALYLTPENYVSFGEDKSVIERLKQMRIDNFKYQIEHPPIQVEPTSEDLIKEQSNIDEQINSLQVRKVELSNQISVMKDK